MTETLNRILLVDDERPIRRFLNASLSGRYKVLEATNGEEALTMAVSSRPDVIILDLSLPDMDGVDVIGRLREWTLTPIVIISVREREEDKIAALDAGADDYLSKPFSVGELGARLRAVMRRSTYPEGEPIFKQDDLVVDLDRRCVSIKGQEVSLTPTEYDILRTMVKYAGKVLTHDQLIKFIWGTETERTEKESHLLRVNVNNLRRKIEADPSRPRIIVTEPGVGYRLKTA